MALIARIITIDDNKPIAVIIMVTEDEKLLYEKNNKMADEIIPAEYLRHYLKKYHKIEISATDKTFLELSKGLAVLSDKNYYELVDARFVSPLIVKDCLGVVKDSYDVFIDKYAEHLKSL